MNINKALPVYAIIFTILLFLLQHISLFPPQAKSIDSPQEVFSAERAYETLKHLLQENKPHPVGSDLNKVIKYRLIEELENLQQSYPTRHYSLETDDSPSSRNKFPQNEEK